MKRAFAFILLIMLGSLSPATAGQSASCGDVAAYLEIVDAAVVQEMYAVVSAPGWAQAASEAQAKIDASDGSYQALTLDEIAPLLDYLGAAGTALEGIDDADVPDSARELHDTAAEYWAMGVDMIEAVMAEGDMAVLPYLERYEDLVARNYAAQEKIRASCADVLLPYEEREEALDAFFAFLDSGEGAERFDDVTPEDMEGMGFFILFFGDPPASGTGESPPATVVPATPES